MLYFYWSCPIFFLFLWVLCTLSAVVVNKCARQNNTAPFLETLSMQTPPTPTPPIQLESFNLQMTSDFLAGSIKDYLIIQTVHRTRTPAHGSQVSWDTEKNSAVNREITVWTTTATLKLTNEQTNDVSRCDLTCPESLCFSKRAGPRWTNVPTDPVGLVAVGSFGPQSTCWSPLPVSVPQEATRPVPLLLWNPLPPQLGNILPTFGIST